MSDDTPFPMRPRDECKPGVPGMSGVHSKVPYIGCTGVGKKDVHPYQSPCTTDDEKGEREAQKKKKKRWNEPGHLKIERNREEVCPWNPFNGEECMVSE